MVPGSPLVLGVWVQGFGFRALIPKDEESSGKDTGTWMGSRAYTATGIAGVGWYRGALLINF